MLCGLWCESQGTSESRDLSRSKLGPIERVSVVICGGNTIT